MAQIRQAYRRSYNIASARTMSMYVDDKLLEKLDRLSQKYHMSRSEFVNRLLTKAVGRIEQGEDFLNG